MSKQDHGLRLLHYSDSPVHEVRSVVQSDDPNWRGGRKPNGFWVSVEGPDDWRSWCASESFRDCDSQVVTEIVLAANHGVLIIGTLEAMLAFHAHYAVIRKDVCGPRQVIDWRRVANRHSGIIIAPYRWDQHLDSPCDSWYYGWDCASGCIWDAAAVAELRGRDGRVEAHAAGGTHEQAQAV